MVTVDDKIVRLEKRIAELEWRLLDQQRELKNLADRQDEELKNLAARQDEIKTELHRDIKFHKHRYSTHTSCDNTTGCADVLYGK